MNIKKHQNILFFMMILFVISSCSIDRRLAKEFISANKRPKVYLYSTDNMFMVSYRPTQQDTTQLTSQQIDSIRFYESKYIQFLDKEKIKTAYEKGFANQLKKYGYEVLINQKMPENLKQDSLTPLSVTYSQIELNEYIKKTTDVGYFNRKEYLKYFDVDAINLDSWINIQRNQQKALFFVHDSISDIIDGYFYQKFSGKVKYRYKKHNMTLDNIYRFVEDIAANQAQYFFDFFLNNYIDNNRKSSKKRFYQYHYDVDKNVIMLIEELPWTKMNPQ